MSQLFPQKLAIFSNAKSRPALKTKRIWQAACVVLIAAALMVIGLASTGKAQNQPERIPIATGAYITPTAAPGSKYQLLALRLFPVFRTMWSTMPRRLWLAATAGQC